MAAKLANLPYLYEGPGSSLWKLTLEGSVGQGGSNRSEDVTLIQMLLNLVPPANGGPSKDLKVTGKCDSTTIDAIKDFQRRACNHRTPDGRVDVNKSTINTLIPLLVRKNLVPSNLVRLHEVPTETAAVYQSLVTPSRHNTVVASSESDTKKLVSGSTSLVAQDDGPMSTVWGAPTDWKIVTTDGAAVSIGPFGATTMTIKVTNKTGTEYVLLFVGISFGTSVGLPIGTDYFTSDMPSEGSQIYRTSTSNRSWNVREFLGPCYILWGELNNPRLDGVSTSLFYFGGQLLAEFVHAPKAIGWLTAAQVGLPTAGVGFTQGYILDWA